MKKHAFVAATLFLLSIIVAAQAVQADETMLVSVPFAFVAGNVTLPAGDYCIRKWGQNSDVLQIIDSRQRAIAMVATHSALAKELQTKSKLVFNRYGERYFLSQVWTAGTVRGRQLYKSSREKEILETARIEGKSEFTLAARLSAPKP